MQSDPEEISDSFLTHLAREQATLQRSYDVLRRVRAAVLQNDLGQLLALQEEQERVGTEVISRRAERDRLRSRVAAELGTNAQSITLSTLTRTMPPDRREPVRIAGLHLRHLANQVDVLVRSDAVLVAHFLRFNRRFLVEITGGNDMAACYGPTGAHREASFGSLLSTRG